MADKTNINELKSQIKNGRVKRLYLFHGPEEYLQKYYINAIEKAIIPEHVKMLNKVVLEGKADQDAIINNCETLPVFSDRKLVIVKKLRTVQGVQKTGGCSKAGQGFN
jgi:DNA polymerase-3 subunit delta